MKKIVTRTLQLTLTSALTLLTHTAFSQGSGHALNFDGASDYLSITNTPIIEPGILTVEAWCKSNTSTWNTRGWVVSQRTSVDRNGFIMHPQQGSNTIRFYVGISGTWHFVGFAPIDITEWHHYAATYDGDTLKFYVDGELKDFTTSPNGNINYNGTSSTLTIGKDDVDYFPTSRYGNGSVDEVRIWDRALTINEIRENMCQKLNGTEPNLVAYYRMDEGIDNSCSGGEDVCDLTGNGNHGTKF